jgi:hypothetical protein
MLYIATAKFCDATPCRLVNSYAYTNTDGVTSQKCLLVVRKECNPQMFRITMAFSPVLPARPRGTPSLLYNGTGVHPFTPKSGRYVTLTTYIPLLPRLGMCGAIPPLPTCVNDVTFSYLSTTESSPSFYKHSSPQQFLWTEIFDDPLSRDGRTVGLFLTAWTMSRFEELNCKFTASKIGRGMAQIVSRLPITCRHGFKPRQVYMEFVVDQTALE